MAEVKLCVCPQCGKKYKLKAEFDAKSFACKGCGATVWVDGKPAAPASRRSGRPGRKRAGARGGGKGRTAARGRGRAAAAAAEEPADGRRSRYSGQQNNSTNAIIAVAGLVLIVGIVLFFLLGKKDEPEATNTASTNTAIVDGQPVAPEPDPGPEAPNPVSDLANTGISPTAEPGDDGTADEPADEPETPKEADDGSAPAKPSRKLGGGIKGAKRGPHKWDPPADMAHLPDTPEETRKQIDELVAVMFDVQAGRDSLDAKAKLVAHGKPAFPRILGKMAQIRDSITDVDSLDERLTESSLKLADEALREMDGYLNSKEKQPIRPGTDKKYVAYILRLHFQRWENTLKGMDEMPGAYIPTDEDPVARSTRPERKPK